MLLPRRNKMLLHDRPCPRNPVSRRLPRNSRKIRQTLADGRDRATPVAEARVPGTLLQNHPEPGTALVDRRHRQTHRRLPQERLRGKHRRQNRRASRDNDHIVNLKEVHPVVSGEIEH
jgi:hypothetical protein